MKKMLLISLSTLLLIGCNSNNNSTSSSSSKMFVPEGYELYKSSSSAIHQFTIYRNDDNKELIFKQTVKSEYNSHVNTEGYLIEEIDIHNYDAICVEYERTTGISSAVIWNSDEYILELHGNFAKDELINLAICNEIESF